MYKLVAIDCDNTLLDSTANIPEKNKKAIQDLKNKGVNFVLATGRNDILVKDYVEELGIDAPVIGCNGGSVRDLQKDKLLKLTPISEDSLKAVFDFCLSKDIKIKAFSMTHSYSNAEENSTLSLSHIIKTYTRVLSQELEHKKIEDMHSLIGKDKLLKLVVVNDSQAFIEETQKQLKEIPDIEVVRSNKNCLDIMKKGVTKGSAVEAYANMLGIDASEVVAFGDSENDFSMLKMAGFAVAMGNGEKILKDIANMVTLTNDEGGVGYALNKIFNLQ